MDYARNRYNIVAHSKVIIYLLQDGYTSAYRKEGLLQPSARMKLNLCNRGTALIRTTLVWGEALSGWLQFVPNLNSDNGRHH